MRTAVKLGWWVALVGVGVMALAGTGRAKAQEKARMHKIVLIAGTMNGHDKNTHEYAKSVILLKWLLDTSSNLHNVRIGTCFHSML